MKLNILITDDHKLIRKGVKLMLESQNEFEFEITEASTGSEALEIVKNNSFDIILLDLSLPDMKGIDVLKSIKKLRPSTPVLIQSMHIEKNIIKQTLASGASGYLLKNAENDELAHAILDCLNNKIYFSNEVIQVLYSENEDNTSETKLLKLLTNRELEILKFISQGNTTQDIAEKLYLSKRTVETHRDRIAKKLNIKTTVGLFQFANSKNIFRKKN